MSVQRKSYYYEKDSIMQAATLNVRRGRSLREKQERSLIRALAGDVAEIAADARMIAIFRRWHDVNALRRPDHAPVWCQPICCFDEIVPPDALFCRMPRLRALERQLRYLLFKRTVDDDTPITPYWKVQAVFDVAPKNTWGVDIGRIDSKEKGGAWAYDPPLKTETDFARLAVPRFTLNRQATERRLAQTSELLGDSFPVRPECGPPLHTILCYWAAQLRGLTEMMMDMALEPERLHRLMAYLRDAVLGAMDQAEATGRLTPNTNVPMFASEPFGPAPVDGRHTYTNFWCSSNAQECDQVSPAMWEEFCLDYQKPIFKRFGRVAYGCCEDLTHKIDGVMTIPNLHMFVSSAWTDLGKVIDAVGNRKVIMWRQKASDVVFPDDTGAIGQHLRNGTTELRGCHYQIVLRELQTLAGHPDRLYVWTRLAKEAAVAQA